VLVTAPPVPVNCATSAFSVQVLENIFLVRKIPFLRHLLKT
jgi:hypothetical protein